MNERRDGNGPKLERLTDFEMTFFKGTMALVFGAMPYDRRFAQAIADFNSANQFLLRKSGTKENKLKDDGRDPMIVGIERAMLEYTYAKARPDFSREVPLDKVSQTRFQRAGSSVSQQDDIMRAFADKLRSNGVDIDSEAELAANIAIALTQYYLNSGLAQ